MDSLNERLAHPERLAALEKTGLLDSAPEPNYDRLTQLVSKLLDVPFSLITYIDDKRQFNKSIVGTDERNMPLSHSYCQYVVADQQALAVKDTREDERLRDNLAIRDFNAVAYLGVPLLSPGGQVLGSLCAVDTKPRDWTDEELELITQFSHIVMSEMVAGQQLRERNALVDALFSSESRLRLALEAGRMGTWDWDIAANKVTFAELTYDVWDIPKGTNLKAEAVFARIHPDDLARVEAAVMAAVERDEDYIEEFRIVKRDGSHRWLSGRGNAIRDETGKAVSVLGVNYDISEEKQTQEQLRRLNTELEALIEERTHKLELLNKELEAFNYSVSHDLRAPLRGIDGFSSALQNEYEDVLDETATHYLSRVRAGAQRMGELIDDLLDLSRLSRSELRLSEVNLTQLVQNITQRLIDQEPEREFRLEIAPNLSLVADKRLLTIALENLLGNALKFTNKRETTHIKFGRSDDGAYFLRDNGVGFDMKFANKLFIPFQRLHTASEFKGSGIGLATVQRIINRHGGRLWADSELGKGTSFYFTLPDSKLKQ